MEGLRIKKFEGIYVSTITPFNEKLEVDFEAIKKHIDFLFNKKVNGIVVCGINGEFSSLTIAERKKVLKTSIISARDRLPVIAGAYSNNYKDTIELINFAEESGADAAIITRPFFFRKPTEEGLFIYFSKILEEINNFPIFLCNVPMESNIELSIKLIERLIEKFSNIIGIKDLSGLTEIILNYAGVFEKLSVLVGSDRMVYNGLNAGCDGAVSAIANIMPEYLLKIYNSYKQGNLDQAWIEQESLIGIRSLLRRFPTRAAHKFIFSRIFKCECLVRPPLENLTKDEKQNLMLLLSDHGLEIKA